MAEVTALSIAIAFCALLAWDAFRRYLAGVDRVRQVRELEHKLAERFARLEAKQAEHARAIGARAIAQAARAGGA